MLTGKEALAFLQNEMRAHPSVAFLDGAGMSTPSGIPDFRGQAGISQVASRYGLSYERLLSVDELMEDPATFFDFYWNFLVHDKAEPNAAHRAVAHYPGPIDVITQNIDGLHQKAGSKDVVELHGSILRNHCLSCGAAYSLEEIPHHGVPRCPKCGGIVRPDIVLYGEELDYQALCAAEDALEESEILIVAGTSLRVYPAAGLIYSSRAKAKILVNAEPTPLDSFFDAFVQGDVANILPEVLK